MKNNPHKVIIAMGSQSDWKTLKFTSSILTQLKIKHQKKIISAHRRQKDYMNLQSQLIKMVLR